jgi:hypothetical protein
MQNNDVSVKVLKSISLVSVLTALMEHEHFCAYHITSPFHFDAMNVSLKMSLT